MSNRTNQDDLIPSGRYYSLKRRLTAGLSIYAILLTLGVLANDFVVNESAEHLAWEALLNAELEHFLNRKAQEPDYPWPETETLQLFALNPLTDADNPLMALSQGVHDEILHDDREKVILLRDVDNQRFVVALDISDLEGREARLRLIIFASAFFLVILLICTAAWGAGRLVRPLSQLADQLAKLDPEKSHQRVTLADNATTEIALITQSVNRYIEKNAAFIEREQSFVQVSSHELRTPIAIIAGAAELALNEDNVPDVVRRRLQRILVTTNDTNELVSMLLALAKDPERLIHSCEPIDLSLLIPDVVTDHEHLAEGKQIGIIKGNLVPVRIHAPLPLVKSAIGNLLRNAIENTHHGDVVISLNAQGDVIIEDEGQGLTEEQVSALYSRLARGEGLHGGGIGLKLIARLCEHLGWSLSVDSKSGEGSRMTLKFHSEILHNQVDRV